MGYTVAESICHSDVPVMYMCVLLYISYLTGPRPAEGTSLSGYLVLKPTRQGSRILDACGAGFGIARSAVWLKPI